MVPPLPPPESRPLSAAGARRTAGRSLSRAEAIGTLRELASERPELVALFDARAVAGERHLLSAWAHLGRARARGEQRLRDRAAEFALYLAGDDQLPRALAKVGVADDTEEYVLVVERPRELASLFPRFGLTEDSGVYPRPPSEATLERLGITAADRSAVPESGWEALVLERVALLELSASHVSPPREKP